VWLIVAFFESLKPEGVDKRTAYSALVVEMIFLGCCLIGNVNNLSQSQVGNGKAENGNRM
jgi:hypothetical protein